jgi:hypothetical protein
MSKFDYGDVVRVVGDAPAHLGPGQKAWIVGVFGDRPGKYFDQFPEGIVYSIEYEDGSSLEVHEKYLVSFDN